MPLSLAGTCAAMWAAGFSIDNLSLMALAVSVGFVVDDAIVMIENVFRNLEAGMSPLRATLKGAKQIGFTVVSISISLIAAFIPLLFMGGIVGRLFREFSVTLAFAIGISTVVSLSVTPMVCAYFVRSPPSPDATRFDRLVEGMLSRMIAFYARTLDLVIAHRGLTLLVFLTTVVLTVGLYIKAPKGYFPQDDTGLVFGGTQASTDISYEAMEEIQKKAMDIVLADPAVAGLGSNVGRRSVWGFGQPRATVRYPQAAGSARRRQHATRGRAHPRQAQWNPGYSRLPGAGRRTCASAGGQATRNTSSRCGARTSRCCKAGCQKCRTVSKPSPA